MAPKRTSVRIPINAELWASGLGRYSQRTLIAWATTIIEAHLEADQRVSLPQPTATSSTATEQTHPERDRSDRPDVDRANNLLGHEQADLYRSTIDGIVDYLATPLLPRRRLRRPRRSPHRRRHGTPAPSRPQPRTRFHHQRHPVQRIGLRLRLQRPRPHQPHHGHLHPRPPARKPPPSRRQPGHHVTRPPHNPRDPGWSTRTSSP